VSDQHDSSELVLGTTIGVELKPKEGFCMRLALSTSILSLAMLAGCATAPKSEEGKANLESEAETTLARLQLMDESLKPFLDKSAGYAVFPGIGKGGLILGGAYGRGVVVEQGVVVGYADLSQATVGAQIGGQKFAEVIAFETNRELTQFKRGEFSFTAQTSAVALKSGAAKSAKYEYGVAVFIEPIAGLMAEAALGGQSFTFQPK
jgi:lipid-binding SYLF domain-containing protein